MREDAQNSPVAVGVDVAALLARGEKGVKSKVVEWLCV